MKPVNLGLAALCLSALSSISAEAQTAPAAAAAMAAQEAAPASVSYAALDRFTTFDAESTRQIDYDAWTEVLSDIVLRVPPSNREPARGRPAQTGSRIYRGNTSRYRHEANRVVYHLMDAPYEEAVHDFRVALETLPERIDLTSLNRDEQLAYWLNLHNVAIIEQILGRYPESNISRTRAIGTSESLFDAKILTVDGVPLSLNDIRFGIVYRNWQDPRVIYGLHNGSIGGPSMLREAYRGPHVWQQLDRNAAEFVNSLRGVDIDDDALKVSHIYGEARHFFPNFDTDLRAHLAQYANPVTMEQLAGNRPLETAVSDWHIADLTNGVLGCGGGGSPVSISAPLERRTNLDNLNCYILPQTGRIMMEYVVERRIEMWRNGEGGIVRVIDLETTDPDEAGAPSSGADNDAPVVNLSPTFGTRGAPSESAPADPEGR